MSDDGVLETVAFLLTLSAGSAALAYFWIDNDRVSSAIMLAAMAFGALAAFVFAIGEIIR